MLGGRPPSSRCNAKSSGEDIKDRSNDNDDLYEDEDEDEQLTNSERERLSSFASGVRGLIAALQAADEASRANVSSFLLL